MNDMTLFASKYMLSIHLNLEELKEQMNAKMQKLVKIISILPFFVIVVVTLDKIKRIC